MKIIEGLKKVKDLQKKAEDLRVLVRDNCVRSSLETDKYPEQTKKVSGWIQSHSDLLKEILHLKIAIQRTNLETEVTIELGEKVVIKSIAEWIHRRGNVRGREGLSNLELSMWEKLGDRGIQEGYATSPSGDKMEVKIIRFFDPAERDKRRLDLQSEPITIDSKLEVVNAVTDLIE